MSGAGSETVARGARRGAGPAWWSQALPTNYLILKFGSDPVWHEMLVCRLGRRGPFRAHKPDGDSYVVPPSAHRSQRSRRRKPGRDEELPEVKWDEVYQTSGYLSPGDLRKLIATGRGWQVPSSTRRDSRAAKNAGGKEPRTLTVVYDGRGERERVWELFCREISVAEFADYLELWAKDKKGEENVRTFLEMYVIMESLEALVSPDQLDRALAGRELMCRRLQTIFDAYDVTPAQPNFESANLLSEAERARDDAEIGKQTQKARELREAPTPEGGG